MKLFVLHTLFCFSFVYKMTSIYMINVGRFVRNKTELKNKLTIIILLVLHNHYNHSSADTEIYTAVFFWSEILFLFL